MLCPPLFSRRSTPSDVVAALMRRRGIELDSRRLDEQAAAQQERDKLEHKQHIADVRAAASAAVKARRAYSVAMGLGSRVLAGTAHRLQNGPRLTEGR